MNWINLHSWKATRITHTERQRIREKDRLTHGGKSEVETRENIIRVNRVLNWNWQKYVKCSMTDARERCKKSLAQPLNDCYSVWMRFFFSPCHIRSRIKPEWALKIICVITRLKDDNLSSIHYTEMRMWRIRQYRSRIRWSQTGGEI